MVLTEAEEAEFERKKRALIQRKAHTKDIHGMESATRSHEEIDESKRWSEQKPFKAGMQQLRDYKAGLFLLDFVEKIECREDIIHEDDWEHWDKCRVHFRNRTQEFFDVNTILTEKHKVKNIISAEGEFEIVFKEPTSVELYTWKGSLIDLNPHDVKRVVMDRKVSPQDRKKVAYRYQFTRKAKKGIVSDK